MEHHSIHSEWKNPRNFFPIILRYKNLHVLMQRQQIIFGKLANEKYNLHLPPLADWKERGNNHKTKRRNKCQLFGKNRQLTFT